MVPITQQTYSKTITIFVPMFRCFLNFVVKVSVFTCYMNMFAFILMLAYILKIGKYLIN